MIISKPTQSQIESALNGHSPEQRERELAALRLPDGKSRASRIYQRTDKKTKAVTYHIMAPWLAAEYFSI